MQAPRLIVGTPGDRRGDEGRETWPVHGVDATRKWEASVAAGLPAHALMERAGMAVARVALAVAPHARRVIVWAGPGNNGGDGLLAAAHLQRAGKAVAVNLLATGDLPGNAAAALEHARRAGVQIVTNASGPSPAEPHDLAIDALFGIGLNRAPAGASRVAIQHLQAGGTPVLAIDLPSGLDADRGRPWDADAVVCARWTLSLLTLKPGLFTAAGRDHAGEVWFDDLDAPAPPTQPPTTLLTGSASLWPLRRHAQHKGSFGDVWIVGGAPGMRGAAWLAGRAALAAGAGRVLVLPLDASSSESAADHADDIDPLHPELMWRTPQALHDRQTPLESATVVCGCGGGAAVRELLPALMARAGRLLLDADAINAIAADPLLMHSMAARARRGRPTVMTPHPLEAARCLATSTEDVQSDRLASARRLAALGPMHVVLKGSGTVMAEPGGAAWVNGSGNAALATAGTGDVLAGWIAGLWSQGLPVMQAIRLGVHTHGRAADRWAAVTSCSAPLEASRLIEELRRLRHR